MTTVDSHTNPAVPARALRVLKYQSPERLNGKAAMYRQSPTPMSLYLAFALTAAVLVMVILVGCRQEEEITPITFGSPALLFDNPNEAPFASTEFGRDAWPATPGPMQSVEETYFTEIYRDYQGNASQERNSPYRYTQRVRRGMQTR